jgi:hypothetical protein
MFRNVTHEMKHLTLYRLHASKASHHTDAGHQKWPSGLDFLGRDLLRDDSKWVDSQKRVLVNIEQLLVWIGRLHDLASGRSAYTSMWGMTIVTIWDPGRAGVGSDLWGVCERSALP